ncbi:BatA domain-containing protein [Brumimicrobium mesophilum]|uniref:BatA domain-containing protein n=1 Tax=Brumimicrobium mesophilum TaxID=392717 RepID=UPI000D143133|nr:BatA domain-containing protein [Brumimicrobium mesophilum]
MNFVYPNILYFLLLLIIPIIIHLFNFRRYKKLYFSSLQFIKKVEKETNATKNLRHYLILTCRMLAFTALIFAFAQPYIPTSTQAKSYENLIPIYLDNSFSMSAKGSNGSLLNQGKTTVQQIADAYPKGQRYLLVTNALNGTEHRVITRSELQDKLEYVNLSPISRAITNPLESMKEYLNSISYDGNSHYYVISDFQKRNLTETRPAIDTAANYSFLQLTPQINRNLYIDSIWFEQPFQRVNTNNTLNIRVQNTGNEKLTNVELNLNVGGTKRQTLTDLEANNSTIVAMNYTDKSTGIKEGIIELMDENLYFDNRFHFTYKVEESINILIINDENSTPLPGMVYETDDFYDIEETSVAQLKTNLLSEADLIVLNGLSNISSGIQTQLKQLATNGIHVLIIPSPEFNMTSYNNLLSSFQLPLFGKATSQEIRIGKISSELDFFIGMFDGNVDNIRMPPLTNYISSSTYSNANFNTLIQYENGMPLLVEQAKGKNVYALYSPVDPNFNNFGKSALFSSLLLRVGEKSQGQLPLSLTIGSSNNYRIKMKGQNESALILKQKDAEFIPEITKNVGFTSISVRNSIDNQSINDGVYSILNDGKTLGKLALNYNRYESDMSYASENEITNYFKSINVSKLNTAGISALSDIQQLTLKKPNEFWRILLILALTFFLLEMLILIFWKV